MEEPTTAGEAGQLVARELASAINTPKLLEEHAKVMNGFTRTRFPPEVRLLFFVLFISNLLYLSNFNMIFDTAQWLLTCWTCEIDEHEL